MNQTPKTLILILILMMAGISQARSEQPLNPSNDFFRDQFRECLFNYSGGGDSAGGSTKEFMPIPDMPDIFSPEPLYPEGLNGNGTLGDGNESDQGSTQPTYPYFNVFFEGDLKDEEVNACWEELGYSWNDILILRKRFDTELKRLVYEGKSDEALKLLNYRSLFYDQEEI